MNIGFLIILITTVNLLLFQILIMKRLLLCVFLLAAMDSYSQVAINENNYAGILEKEKILFHKQISLIFNYQFLEGRYRLGIKLAWKNYSAQNSKTESSIIKIQDGISV